MINFRLDEMIVEMIDKAAQINDMSRSEIIRQILADYFRKEIITKIMNNEERIKQIEEQYIEYLDKYKYDNNKIDHNAQTALDRVHNIFLKMLEEVYYVDNKTINKNIKQQQQRSKREKKHKAKYKEYLSTTQQSYNNIEDNIVDEYIQLLQQKFLVKRF